MSVDTFYPFMSAEELRFEALSANQQDKPNRGFVVRQWRNTVRHVTVERHELSVANFETAAGEIARLSRKAVRDSNWLLRQQPTPPLMQMAVFVDDTGLSGNPYGLILMCHWVAPEYRHLAGYGMGMANHNGGAR
jgi:hypothetical protein